MTTQKDSAAASEGVPERIWIPTSAAMLMEVSPELQNVEGAWYVRESVSPSVDEASVRQAAKKIWEYGTSRQWGQGRAMISQGDIAEIITTELRGKQ